MEEQSFAKHTRFVPMFHFTLLPITALTLIGAIVVLVRAFMHGSGRLEALLVVALSYAAMSAALFGRLFALKAQDRAIRAEENLRHFVLAGKPLDSRLTVQQIIGLRFASDGELIALAGRAASENLSRDDIKKAVRNWKADHHRV